MFSRIDFSGACAKYIQNSDNILHNTESKIILTNAKIFLEKTHLCSLFVYHVGEAGITWIFRPLLTYAHKFFLYLPIYRDDFYIFLLHTHVLPLQAESALRFICQQDTTEFFNGLDTVTKTQLINGITDDYVLSFLR